MDVKANRTTGFDADVFVFIANKCEKEDITWNVAVNILIRKAMGEGQ